ncbi:TrkA family potassium uptake protein [bacterium]|nr:TrkA family potassium uptake protein [bacterium]
MRQCVVVGLGIFGAAVAKTLVEKGCEVLAIDEDEEKVKEISNIVTQAVQADATDEKTLRSLGVDKMDMAVISTGENMEASILVTLLIKELGVKTIVAKAISPSHGTVLRKIGATRVVFPERDTGVRLAENLASPDILEHIALSPEYGILEVHTPKSFIGSTLRKINVRAKHGVIIIAIKRKLPYLTETGESDFKEEILITPEADEEVADGDILVVLGPNKKIDNLRNL